MGASRKDAWKFMRLLSDCRRVSLKMVVSMIELGDPAYAAQLLRRFHAPFYAYIVTLPLREGADLFSQYIGPMSPRMRLKVAQEMRRTSPRWCQEISQLSRAVRTGIRVGTNNKPTQPVH
jgi:hypothetical protein